MNFNYAFTLGREEAIAIAELKAVITSLGIDITREKQARGIFFAHTDKAINSLILMRRLGGTIKIAERISLKDSSADSIAAYLDSILPEEKIHFSVNGGKKNFGLEIKKKLKEIGRSVRYIEPKNTATILHNQLVERKSDIFCTDEGVFATVAIQPFEEWSARDYGRPGRDSKSGMLPPKLARILLNLSKAKQLDTVLDPFCGSGTVLMEALLLGFSNIIGTDLSEKAVTDSKKNTAWLQALYQLSKEPRIFVSDVRSLPEHIPHASIDAIVTEPYLGKPLTGKQSLLDAQKQGDELTKLFIATFESFAFLLKPGGVVIWVMPAFRSGQNWIRLDHKKIIGNHFSIEPLSKTSPSLLYAREDQYVGREIWKIRKI